MIRYLTTGLLAFAAAPMAGAHGQNQITLALRPTAAAVTVTKDVEYGRSDTVTLRMDIYRPAGGAWRRAPTLVFFNRGSGADRQQPFYIAWARAAASRGVTAILPDLRDGSQANDFRVLVSALASRGPSLGVNGDAIAVFAGSGNVYAALPAVQEATQTAVKAAIMYYGAGPVTDFRLDLPLLYVRAGLDRPEVNADITALVTRAASQNAPVTFLNHASGYHAFEMFNDDDATRAVMEQTLSFVRQATSPAFQAAMRRGVPEASAAGYVQVRDYAKAAPIYAQLVAARPDDARLRLSYGEALLGNAQYAEACSELEKVRGKGLGPRDLGLPAARACMQKGDAEAAMTWLKSIPSRFLPPGIRTDPVFAPLQHREDFRALFPDR